MLKFSVANTKIKQLAKIEGVSGFLNGKRKVYSLDLLSGLYCPYASDCKSMVVIGSDGKKHIQDGPNTVFRCFSASQEVLLPAVYNSRKHNSDVLRSLKLHTDMAKLIADSMPQNLGICRIHVGGDFFNQLYFDAWLYVARIYPDRLFYAYTKSLPFWISRLDYVPSNMVLTASYGGLRDELIQMYKLRYAKVVFSENEANSLGLDIDHDDSHAANPLKKDESFALLIHGTQPKGSIGAKIVTEQNRKKVKK